VTSRGVILYGPPGSGKDTVTAELAGLRSEYVLFRRLKAGPGRTAGYRATSTDHIESLSLAGKLLYENARYDARYAIDTDSLAQLFDAGEIPVLHMGQVAGVAAVSAFPANWGKVLLWCPRQVTAVRCRDRGDKDLEARLKVWEETRHDLLDHPEARWSLVIDTSGSTPSETAAAIDLMLSSGDHGANWDAGPVLS
jgi:guanylate kinase